MYQDCNGKWHGVSSIEQVPARYRDRIESVERNDPEVVKQPAPEPKAEPKKKEEIVVVGAAPEPVKEIKEEDKIKARIAAYMEATLADDWEKAYEFINKDVNKSDYKDHFDRIKRLEKLGYSVIPTDYSIKSIRIDPENKNDTETAIARVIERLPLQGGDTHVTRDYEWVKEFGEWYRKIKPSIEETKQREQQILAELRQKVK